MCRSAYANGWHASSAERCGLRNQPKQAAIQAITVQKLLLFFELEAIAQSPINKALQLRRIGQHLAAGRHEVRQRFDRAGFFLEGDARFRLGSAFTILRTGIVGEQFFDHVLNSIGADAHRLEQVTHAQRLLGAHDNARVMRLNERACAGGATGNGSFAEKRRAHRYQFCIAAAVGFAHVGFCRQLAQAFAGIGSAARQQVCGLFAQLGHFGIEFVERRFVLGNLFHRVLIGGLGGGVNGAGLEFVADFCYAAVKGFVRFANVTHHLLGRFGQVAQFVKGFLNVRCNHVQLLQLKRCFRVLISSASVALSDSPSR